MKGELPNKEGLDSRYICRVRGELGLGPFTDCPNAAFPNALSVSGTMAHYAIATSIGTFTFLAFGTSSGIYQFWHCFARQVYNHDWANLHRLLTDEKALMHESRNMMEMQPKRQRVESSTISNSTY